MIWNVSNVLTLVRIVLVPVFAVLFYLPVPEVNWIIAALFLAAALTDWLDGYLARYFNQVSKLGAFLDPVADKLMVVVALVLLLSYFPYWWFALPVASIIVRELVVSALREWMAEIGQRSAVKVSSYGKIKTVLQMTAIIILLIKYRTTSYDVWVIIGFIMLYAAVLLTVYSMLLYLQAGYRALKHEE